MCMVVYVCAGLWHDHTSVLVRENTFLLTVLSEIFRYSTEALNVKHVVRVWLSHHVRETGSLCEHDLMFCCVTEKSLLTLSLLVTIDVMMLFVWTRPWQGITESDEVLLLILDIRQRRKTFKDLWTFLNREMFVQSPECGWGRKKLASVHKPFSFYHEPNGCNETQTVERNIWGKREIRHYFFVILISSMKCLFHNCHCLVFTYRNNLFDIIWLM